MLCIYLQPSACDQCTCDSDGIVNCLVADCAPPPCVNPVYQKGKCCPECTDGTFFRILVNKYTYVCVGPWTTKPVIRQAVAKKKQACFNAVYWLAVVMILWRVNEPESRKVGLYKDFKSYSLHICLMGTLAFGLCMWYLRLIPLIFKCWALCS